MRLRIDFFCISKSDYLDTEPNKASMKYFFLVFLSLFLNNAVAQSTEDDFLAGKLENPEEITVLFLENRNLTELPDIFDKLPNLETLYLSGNQLDILPKSLLNLKNLKTLDLSDNKMVQLPKGFDNLKDLEMLVLNNNKLTSFDLSLCNLKNLDFLHVSNNQIPEISDCITNLTKLTSLGIGGNPFANFPVSIMKLSKLEILLYENQNTEIPSLKSLKNLKTLYINQSLYEKNKSKIKLQLPSGCKVNPKPVAPPPISPPKIYEADLEVSENQCFVNVLKTESKNKVETIETILDFEFDDNLARITFTTELHEGENIKQKIDDAEKQGMKIVPALTTEHIEGKISIENNILTFKSNDLKTTKVFQIVYKKNSKSIDELKETSTSRTYKTGPCYMPTISIGY